MCTFPFSLLAYTLALLSQIIQPSIFPSLSQTREGSDQDPKTPTVYSPDFTVREQVTDHHRHLSQRCTLLLTCAT